MARSAFSTSSGSLGRGGSDAAAAYLKMVHRPCTLEEIKEALQRGGLVFAGKDPKSTLYTQLVRATLRFVKLPTGEFALLDWYEREKNRRLKRGGEKSGSNGSSKASDDISEEPDDHEEEPMPR